LPKRNFSAKVRRASMYMGGEGACEDSAVACSCFSRALIDLGYLAVQQTLRGVVGSGESHAYTNSVGTIE
jgi:hypothetical protein